MSDELHALLARAANEIEGSAPSLDGGRLGVVRAAARRRRLARRTAESFAGVGAVGVLGAGLWFGLGQQAPEPVVPVMTPTATPSPAPLTVTPTPTSTPTPTGPPTRAESIDDATVIARLSAPRTGEVWQTPVAAPELESVFGEHSNPHLVGTRGDASIYITMYDELGTWRVGGLFEVDAQGVRRIACPSARTVDLCDEKGEADRTPRWVRDEDTFYDTLTLPASIDLGDGFTVTTTNTARTPRSGFMLYGDADPIMKDDVELRVLRDLGPVDVAARVTDFSPVPGVTDLTYGVATPFGTFVRLDAADIPAGDFAAIRWDDGIVRVEAEELPVQTVAPGGQSCLWTTFSQDDAHVPGDWRPGGTTPDGRRVYLPVAGGNPLSRAARAWQEEHSWTVGSDDGVSDELVDLYGADAGYAYPTDAAFLEANALYAVQGPGGQWLLGMRQDALNVVYECV
jgi:hypothetical protein